MSSRPTRFLIVHHDKLIGQALTDSIALRSGWSACEPVTTSVDAFAQVQKDAVGALLVAWERSAPDAAALVHLVLGLLSPPQVIVFGVPDEDTLIPPKCWRVKQSEGMPLLLQHLATATAPTELPMVNGTIGVTGHEPNDLTGLTTRQAQVYELLVRGYSNKQIAATLGISLYTAKSHVHVVLSKANAESRHSLPHPSLRLAGRNPVEPLASRNGTSGSG